MPESARQAKNRLHTVLAVNVYSDKIKHLLDAAEGQEVGAALAMVGSSSTAGLNIKPNSRLEGLIKMSDLVSSLVLWNRSNPGSLLAFFFSVICAVLHFFTVALLLSIFSLVMISINLAAICTLTDYHTRPLDTIFSNFIDALPIVSFETPGLVYFQLDFFVLFFGIDLAYCAMCKLGIAQKTTSASFTSQHVKCMGKR
ncbi:hypothetical protein ZIOFF_022553 [Zingiber officinale]|uniref:Uncharacterized protein n=1 Tax=Zingiber officinale TaxID=94328 RepID=A0A8J5LMU6_ZINOF|nr:hypothetical protein ZIOFF_022553 [Zingiber officinale]